MKANLYFIAMLFFLLSADNNLYSQAPDFLWANRTGNGTESEYGTSIVTDAAGNIYVTGMFSGSVDFDAGPGTFTLTSAGIHDIFISKTDASGNLSWAKALGGLNGFGESYAIAVDPSGNGNIYTTGYYYETIDFDPGAGTFDLTSDSGSLDIFISKLDSAGNFVWAKSIGGSAYDDYSYSIAVDIFGNIYTTGFFAGTTDFDPGTGIFNMTPIGYSDVFISKLDSSGNYVWAKSFGGIDEEAGNDITVGPSGNIYTTGYFWDTVDFDPGPATYNLSAWANDDIFISKLDSSGNFIWAKRIGDVDYDGGVSLALDGNENVYLTGYFGSTVDFDPGAAGTFNLTAAGLDDIFIYKSDSAGNFVWARAMGGSGGDDFSMSIALDNSGNVYSYGYFWDVADFDPGPGTFNLTPASSFYCDIFISKLDGSGNFVWATPISGAENEYGTSMTVDSFGNLFATGFFYSPSISLGNFSLVNADNTASSSDMFIAKLGTCSAHFTVYPDTVPHNWFAVNQASGAAPLTYLWTWGDGDSSTGAFPSHTYVTAGYYNICLTITDAAGCTSTYCDSSVYLFRGQSSNTMVTVNVVLQLPTGITEQMAAQNEVIVFPNPASGQITIQAVRNFTLSEVSLSDMTGKLLISCRAAGANKLELNTNNIANGVYLLRIQADFIDTRLVIIQH